jgi:hypothetical protein
MRAAIALIAVLLTAGCASIADADKDGDGFPDNADNCPDDENNDQADADGDSAGDACDCRPEDDAIGALIAAIDLSDGPPVIEALGFDPNNWTPAAGGLLVSNNIPENDREDAILIAFGDRQIQDVHLEVTAAALRASQAELIADFDDQDDRLILLLARYVEGALAYQSSACGIRVDETQIPLGESSQRTQVLDISGDLGAPQFSARDDIARTPVNVDEEFRLEFTLRGNVATCSSVLLERGDATFTVETPEALVDVGAIGLMTRETRASFKELRACEVF